MQLISVEFQKRQVFGHSVWDGVVACMRCFGLTFGAFAQIYLYQELKTYMDKNVLFRTKWH